MIKIKIIKTTGHPWYSVGEEFYAMDSDKNRYYVECKGTVFKFDCIILK